MRDAGRLLVDIGSSGSRFWPMPSERRRCHDGTSWNVRTFNFIPSDPNNPTRFRLRGAGRWILRRFAFTSCGTAYIQAPSTSAICERQREADEAAALAGPYTAGHCACACMLGISRGNDNEYKDWILHIHRTTFCRNSCCPCIKTSKKKT